MLPTSCAWSTCPRFLRYLIGSRQVDVVLSDQQRYGYLFLPYLRAHFPDPCPLSTYCHMENEQRNNGGFPRLIAIYSSPLDANRRDIAARQAVDGGAGGDAGKIVANTCTFDRNVWQPMLRAARTLRRELGLADDYRCCSLPAA